MPYRDRKLDPIRLAEIVVRLPALARVLGHEHPTGALDYVSPDPDDAELNFLVDVLLVSSPRQAGRREAWARLDEFIEKHGLLDVIAESMATGEATPATLSPLERP